MIVAKVDRDYIYRPNDPDDKSEVDARWSVEHLSELGFCYTDVTIYTEKTRWRLKDDDGNVYYGGWLYDDDECNTQQAILSWGQWNAGATTIEIRDDDSEWRQDIG